MAESEKRFADYSWADDKIWRAIEDTLDFPAQWDEKKKEDFLLKRKRKYYQHKVDPTYIPPPDISSTSSFSSTSSSATSAASSFSSPREGTYNDTFNKYEAKPETNQSTEPPKKSAPKPKSQNRQSGGGGASMVQRFANYYYLISQWLVLVLGLASIIFSSLYYRAVLVATVMHFMALIQNAGRPQWNRYYVERVVRDENSLIAFQTVVLLLGPPSIIFISPNLLRALFMGSYMLDGILGNSEGLGNKLYGLLHPHLSKITSQHIWFNTTVALLEVCVGIYLIVCVFFMKGALVTVFLYWQILGTKYTLNANTKVAFAHVNAMIESNLQRVPAVLNVYQKITGYLHGMVDPEQIAARQAQQGNRRCLIM